MFSLKTKTKEHFWSVVEEYFLVKQTKLSFILFTTSKNHIYMWKIYSKTQTYSVIWHFSNWFLLCSVAHDPGAEWPCSPSSVSLSVSKYVAQLQSHQRTLYIARHPLAPTSVHRHPKEPPSAAVRVTSGRSRWTLTLPPACLSRQLLVLFTVFCAPKCFLIEIYNSMLLKDPDWPLKKPWFVLPLKHRTGHFITCLSHLNIGSFTPWKISITVTILAFKPRDHNILFITSQHYSYVVCCFKSSVSLKLGGFWCSLNVFSIHQLKKKTF